MEYVVILKKDSERATDALSILLCLFSAVSFFYRGFQSGRLNYPALGFAVILLIGLLINLVTRRQARLKGSPVNIRYRYWLLIAAIGWIGLTPTPWVGAFFFVLTFLEYQTKRPLEIGFDRDKIIFNTLIKQRFDWTMFNNIILKDGLLTLDFKNNKLLQKEVADDDDEDDADEEEFNAWCQHNLLLWNK